VLLKHQNHKNHLKHQHDKKKPNKEDAHLVSGGTARKANAFKLE
jgi:hypothetical protein